jgi:hypothetical protein
VKLWQYRQLPSICDVLIVSYRGPRLMRHRHDGQEWHVMEARHRDTVRLESIAAGDRGRRGLSERLEEAD